MLNFKFIKRASILFVLTFVLFSHNVSMAQERVGRTKNLTSIEIKDVKIERKEGSLKVSFILENPNAKAEFPLSTYLLMLEDINPLIKSKSGLPLRPLIVAVKEGELAFSLSPLEKGHCRWIFL